MDKEIAALSSQQIAYRHLLTISDVAPLFAAAFLSEVDATLFSCGRELWRGADWFPASTFRAENSACLQ
ncbi:hypothetical protein TUM9757_51540 (plasmid) [Escherichia coli]|nr:hypothetical protein TUM9757_51540 [Escherichia coli]